MKIPKFIAKLFIPKGPYCYTNIKYMRPDKNHPFGYMKVKRCPFWGMDANQEPQNNGYCTLLGIHDWDNDNWGISWDSIKECSINFDWDTDNDN